jgi:hypothetical protein
MLFEEMLMAYNFDLEVTTRISRELAEKMIRQVVEEQTGKEVDHIEVRMARTGKGGATDTYESVFDGFAITFKQERPAGASNPEPNKGFVKAVWQ